MTQQWLFLLHIIVQEHKPNKKMDKEKNKISKMELNGLNDILPKDENYWRTIYETAKNISELHDFHFINVAPIEKYEIFEDALGENKKKFNLQIFSFKMGKQTVALRYSFRESILRSFIQHKLAYFSYPLKVFYTGPVFRNIEVNQYFFKVFNQIGFQVIGESDPFYDGEIIMAFYDLFRSLKLSNVTLKISSAGCKNCRSNFKNRLERYYKNNVNALCNECKKNLEFNPFLVGICGKDKCLEQKENSPTIFDNLCNSCSNYLKAVIELIEDNNIPYTLDEHLMSFSDFNNRTMFEFSVPEIPYPLAFGSRYDYLAEKVFKKPIQVVGGNLGVERVMAAMMKQKINPKIKSRPKVFFLVVGAQAKHGALKLMNKLRLSGVAVVEVIGKKTLESQIKTAEKMGIHLAVLLGQKEIYDGTAIIRDMTSGAQETVLADKLVEEVKKRLS